MAQWNWLLTSTLETSLWAEYIPPSTAAPARGQERAPHQLLFLGTMSRLCPKGTSLQKSCRREGRADGGSSLLKDRLFQNTKSWNGLAQTKPTTKEVYKSPAFGYGNLTHLSKLLNSLV